MFYPISYDEPLFRPPSEAFSLILQVTYGCSWNRCAFCEMYSTKKFHIRDIQDVKEEIKKVSGLFSDTRKVFLADGNPMCLPSEYLMEVLQTIKQYLPKVRQVSTYALPKDLIAKSTGELEDLKKSGLRIIYTGVETGDDELLALCNKGETHDSTVIGLNKAKAAGIKISAIILSGLGGKKYSIQHALNSAKLINAVQPEFLSTLVLSFPFGEKHYEKKFRGNYVSMSIEDLLEETKLFIENLDLNQSIYRSNHASNYLSLEGVFPTDKERLLQILSFAIQNPDRAGFREEWQRGL